MAKQLAHVPDCPCETCAEARPAEYRAPARANVRDASRAEFHQPLPRERAVMSSGVLPLAKLAGHLPPLWLSCT